jgi:hypothetical protein
VRILNILIIFALICFSNLIQDSDGQYLENNNTGEEIVGCPLGIPECQERMEKLSKMDGNWEPLETCTTGNYGDYFGLGSWGLEAIENKSGLCNLNYSYEIEMGYKKFHCQIPTNELKTIDWNSNFPPIPSDLVEQYCTLEKSGNAINDLAFYWYLAIFAMIASTIGIGASIFFMMRKLRKQKKIR